MKKKGSKSISLVICYLGKLPWYFDYFIHSCKYNPSVDFLIITDDTECSRALPRNIKLIFKTLEELNHLASTKLGFKVNIKNGYKLCDFKPVYGLMFSDLLQQYDFWGHGDLDVIFGDIREFMTDEILGNYDLISVRHDFLSGQFLLFKNDYKMNTLFMQSRDYIKVLSSENHYCFDETNFQWAGFTEGKLFSEIPSEIESMTHLVRRLETKNYLKAFFDFLIIEGVPGNLKWINGKLFYKGKFEIMMYHLVLFKKVSLQIKRNREIPAVFNISPSKIYN